MKFARTYKPFIFLGGAALESLVKVRRKSAFLPQFTPKIFVISRQSTDVFDNTANFSIHFSFRVCHSDLAHTSSFYSFNLYFFLGIPWPELYFIVHLSRKFFSPNADKSLSPLLLNQYRMDGLGGRTRDTGTIKDARLKFTSHMAYTLRRGRVILGVSILASGQGVQLLSTFY